MKKTLTITLVAAAVIAAALLFPWNLDVRNRDNIANRIQYDSTAEIRTCYDLSGAITCRDTVFPE